MPQSHKMVSTEGFRTEETQWFIRQVPTIEVPSGCGSRQQPWVPFGSLQQLPLSFWEIHTKPFKIHGKSVGNPDKPAAQMDPLLFVNPPVLMGIHHQKMLIFQRETTGYHNISPRMMTPKVMCATHESDGQFFTTEDPTSWPWLPARI